MSDTVAEDVIVLDNVWKIFGPQANEALKAARDGRATKADIAEQFDCIVGVSGASATVRRGEIFCVMGLSGSGKSTLVRHINRLLEPTAGRIIVEGENILAMTDAELRAFRTSRIGIVFQNFALLPHRTVRENVQLPLEIKGEPPIQRYDRAESALEKVDLAGWGDRMPSSLSGGMQQRVGLARALVADPPILLMDEPFSALDPLIRTQLQNQFMHLSHELGKTTVFITHDLDEAIRIGERIAIMKDGQIVQIGTAEEIVANPQDGYVADFVANISRLNVVHAHRIMEPVDEFRSRQPNLSDFSDFPVARGETTLSDLIEIAALSEKPISVANGDGATVGIIDKSRLLLGIRGGVA